MSGSTKFLGSISATMLCPTSEKRMSPLYIWASLYSLRTAPAAAATTSLPSIVVTTLPRWNARRVKSSASKALSCWPDKNRSRTVAPARGETFSSSPCSTRSALSGWVSIGSTSNRLGCNALCAQICTGRSLRTNASKMQHSIPSKLPSYT
ncbi:hypothetical protein SDC9_192094 [bioreactor metagenome]|uniref:Uncharacterized protein n=1 Tax=bioreactor metagenome TaxID=1076179 RepID=A0A645I286_9ZZZZ